MPALPARIDPEEHPQSLYEGIEYKEFWTGLRRRRLDELEQVVVRKLLPISGRRIIDVGCGYGRLADCYLSRFQQVVMVDGSMSLLRQAFERTKGRAICIASDATHLPFQAASFDAVLMIRVFHHIEDSRACLSELSRVACSNGRLVFSYRNKRDALKVMRWLKGARGENPFSSEPAGVGSTLISHHPRAIHRMLRESGFSDLQYYGAGVLDWFSSKIGFVDRWNILGERLAPFFGRSKIAPWILCGATAHGNTQLNDAKDLEGLLQCPSCGGGISGDHQGYICLVCKEHYPVEGGIIDLRVR